MAKDACSICGAEVYRVPSSRDEIACHACRKMRRRVHERPLVIKQCKNCGAMFETARTDKFYCRAECRRSVSNWDKKKPPSATSTERGYGVTHKRERAKWKPLVERGEVACCLCGDPIEPGSAWHLDHTPDRTGYRGAAHAACNVRDGAIRGAKRTPRPVLAKHCLECSKPFETIYPKQAYCSTACRPKRRPKPKPERKAPTCIECSAPIHQGKRCKPCASEHWRQYMRNRYRERVGIPLNAPKYDRSWRAA